MSLCSSFDYFLKKSVAIFHETSPESFLDGVFQESKSSTELPLLVGDENSAINSTNYTKYFHFVLGTGKLSIEAEINSSISTTENWTNLLSAPTSKSKAYLEIEDDHNSESDAQFPNETYSIAEHLFESWWNIFDERYLKHGWSWTIILIMAYILILVFGVIGNVMVILVVLLRPQMRTVTNMFITNLAVADLFVIVFCVPSTLLANIFSPWILGSIMCKAVAYVQGVSGCASAYSLAAISLDRCQAVYRNYERPRGFSKRICVRTVLMIWIAALSLTIPWAVVFEVKVSEYDGFRYCIETWDTEIYGNMYFLFVNLLCFYAIPLLMIFVSNWIVYCHVKHRTVPEGCIAVEPVRKMHRDTRHHVLKMLGIITLTFLFCWLPIYVLVIIIKFSENISESEYHVLGILMPIAQWLGSVNSGLNPIFYAFRNKKFREMCTSILPAWFPCKTSVKYVASCSTFGFTTTAYSIKGIGRSTTISKRGSRCHRQNGHSHLPVKSNLLITRFCKNTMTTTAIHTLASTKPITSVFRKCSLRNNYMATAERATLEIITDV